LFLLSGGLLLVLLAVRVFIPLPPFLEVFRKVASIALIIAIAWLSTLAILHNRHRLLWRVRRKLIISYLLLGFVPVMLVVVLVLAASVVVYTNVAAYVFHEGFADLLDDVHQIAETSANEIGRTPAAAESAITRKYENLAKQYPKLSLAVVAVPGSAAPATNAGSHAATAPRPVAAGAWRHLRPPDAAPPWLSPAAASGFRGVVTFSASGAPDDVAVVVRAAVPTADQTRVVVADLPVDTDIITRLQARTTVRMGAITAATECGVSGEGPASATDRTFSLFRESVAFMDCTDWATGKSGRLSINLSAPLGQLFGQVTSGQHELATGILLALLALGFFCVVFQGAALVLGIIWARQITYAVHELFTGTERIQQGDFGHRIKIESRDQMSDLGESFNRMSASMEHLLHVQREKQRLDDELRIARDIQKSLLPAAPPRLAGLGIADLCEPAREVGGDYYDFFELGPRKLGVLVADVSGKGTSAALYMAELKGLMLALSYQESSPRRLLIDVNRRLAAHLDNRSFITMTYAVIDLDAQTLTCARAGHTPLLVVSDGRSEVLVPSGMVLGLRLPGAGERFEELLVEHTHHIKSGDVVVIYTDGITEAMDVSGELFGDAALARLVAREHRLDAPGIRERVLREVRAFVGEAEPHDDMTMIVLKFEGLPPSAGRVVPPGMG